MVTRVTGWEQEVLGLQLGLLDPCLQGVPGGLGDLELYWALGLVLHDDGARRQLIAMTHVADLEGDEVAAAKLASIPRLKRASSRTRLSI